MELNTSEKMLMALLCGSLNKKTVDISCFKEATEDDWGKCYRLSRQHGVMALAWDGTKTLPEKLQVPCDLRIVWALAVEKYEKKYVRYCRTIDELTALYAKYGIATVQLKGVGLSTYYPIPSHREGGDIDIFTYSADRKCMTDEQANHLADELMEKQGVQVEMHSYKHSNFYYKDIPIENHKVFLNVKQHEVISQADIWLKESMNPMEVQLVDGTYRIWMPSSTFSTLFLAFHSLAHYGSGMALHHLCDWAVLIKCYGVEFPDALKDKSFLRAVAAMTTLCNRYLGTSTNVTDQRWGKALKMAEVEAFADEMLDEILHSHFPHKAKVSVKGKWNILLYKTRRFLYMARTKNRILYLPLWKRIWVSVVAHFRRPETIFKTQVD